MSQSIHNILDRAGKLGVEALKQDVQKVSATGETAESIRYEVKSTQTMDRLLIYGRQFFSALETGRGPIQNNQQGEFKENILEWMKARGIGADLSEKKRLQLARFFTYKINKEGDQIFKQGGRVVYSPTITKLVMQLKDEVIKDFAKLYLREIVKTYKAA